MHSTDKRLFLWWVVLVALTILSFESSWGLAWLRNPVAAIALVVVIALLKVRIVILNFMEVRHAPWLLRLPLELWLIALASAILWLWYNAGA